MRETILFLLLSVALMSKGQDKMPLGAFAIDFHSHIYLRNIFSGKPAHFLFDTGADYAYPDSTFLANSHFAFKNIERANIGGAGGHRVIVPLIMDKITNRFGHEVYTPPYTPVLQLKPLLGDFADGIIGIECFLNRVFEINYFHKYMRICQSVDSSMIKGFTPIAFLLKKNRIYIPASISVNNTVVISGLMSVDLGSGGSFTLTSSTAEKYKLDSLITHKLGWYYEYYGIGGEGDSYDFRASKASIGTFELKDVVMDYSSNKGGALSDRDYIGIIGNDIWSRFDVIFDLKNEVMYLRPNENYAEPFGAGRLGFGYVDRSQTLGYWVVSGMQQESKAEKAGLKVDDHILSLNDTLVNTFDIDRQDTLFSGRKHLDLQIQRGKEIHRISFDTEDPHRI
jgi:hypothetical protein